MAVPDRGLINLPFFYSIGIERAEECSRVGIGLYLGLSVLDHSCRPNVVGNYNPNDYRYARPCF